VPGARVERACPAFQTGALTATASLANLVEEEGVEPSFAGCRPAVLPLNDSPKNWLRAGELNATRMAYEACMTPVHLPASKLWSGKLGSNQRPLDYQSSAQTTLSFSRKRRATNWSPAPDSNWLFRITGPAHRQLCLQGL
jgi:hypothetical protein